MLEEVKSLNIGILIVGGFFALELGSLQGLYPVVNDLKIPTLIAFFGVFYTGYLILSGQLYLCFFSKQFSIFCLYLILNIVILTISHANSENQLKLMVSYISYFTIVLCTVKSLSEFVLLLDILLASMAYSCLHGMFQGGIVWGNQWLSDENIYAVFCTIGIPYAFVMFSLYKSVVKKLCYAICLILYTVGNFLALSRGGFLAFAGILIIMWWYGKKKLRSILFLGILLMVSLSFIPTDVYHELKQITVDEQQNAPGERFYLWRLGINMFKDHMVFGIGMGNYGEYYTKYDIKAEGRDTFGGVTWRGHKWVVHSTPVSFLAESGIIGTVLLVILLYKIWSSLKYILRMMSDPFYTQLAIASISSLAAYWIGAMFLTLSLYPFFFTIIIITGVFIKIVSTDYP
jgi:O-antigen ligase